MDTRQEKIDRRRFFPRAEAVESRALMTTVIPFTGQPSSASITRVGQYLLAGKFHANSEANETFNVSVSVASATKIIVNFASGTNQGFTAILKSGGGNDAAITNNHPLSTHANNTSIVLAKPSSGVANFQIMVTGGFQTLAKIDVPYRIQINVVKTATSPMPTLSGTIDSSIHQILYRGQVLSVPLAVMNAGSTAVNGNVKIAYYLSQNQNVTTTGDVLLNTVDNQPLKLAVGASQEIINDVVVPKTTKIGIYYVKAVMSPASKNAISTPNSLENAVSIPLTEIDATNSMTVMNPKTKYSRADAYEWGVDLAKDNPNYRPSEFATGFGDAAIKQYIKDNEGWEPGPYLDTNGIPTIGWGFALEDKTSKGTLVPDPLAQAQIASLDATLRKTNHIGLIDPRDPKKQKHLTFDGLLELAKANGSNTSEPLRYPLGGFTQAFASPWFDQDFAEAEETIADDLHDGYDTEFSSLPGNVQAVLVDMYYNIGEGFIDGANAFSGMIGYIGNNQLAYAGFELMNSDYGTGFPLPKNGDASVMRTIKNFRLLVGVYAVQL